MEIIVTPYGEIDGQAVEELTISNDHNISISVLTYGCIINHICTPDRDGKLVEIRDDAIMIHLHRVSPDNEACYPGNLSVTHTVGLDNNNQLHLNFRACTDKPTVVNLVNHGYYNLSGHDQGTIHGQELSIFAEHYTPVAENLIPTSEIRAVAGTGLDFRLPTILGDNMQKMPNQLIDHNFVLSKAEKEGDYHKAAELYDPKTGRVMTVLTTQPGVQFYNAGKLSNRDWYGKDNHKYQNFEGLCLETQHFPDSPNQAHFPSTRLDPSQIYEEKTIHRFSVR